ncbi:MAG: sulfotransferase [Planctomycetota bacterium]
MNWFLIACAERTGSNLLVSMLDSHPKIGCAGEVFNQRHLEDRLPWRPAADRLDLIELRKQDPARMFAELGQIAEGLGKSHFGFKITYNQWLKNPQVVDLIRGVPGVRLIHLLRRNRLRRLVSNEVARKNDVWKVPVGTPKPPVSETKVELAFADLINDFRNIERQEVMVEEALSGSPRLTVLYEDMAADPQSAGAQATDFLGLPRADLAVKFEKSGKDDLRDVVSNFDELKSKLQHWVDFFDS